MADANESDNPIGNILGGVAVLGDLMKAAGDSADVREAGANLGKAALTLSRTVNTVLLPLAALNFAVEKARNYFEQQFPADVARKGKDIPQENIVEPKASIAGPVLQGLTFTHEEPPLREMYLSLLATAMDGRVSATAHPAFVEIIKQLNSSEAVELRKVLKHPAGLPIIEIRLLLADNNGWTVVVQHCLNARSATDDSPVEMFRQAAMVDNWVRLGLLEVSYDKFFLEPDSYAWGEKRPEYLRAKAAFAMNGKTIDIAKGVLKPTAFGQEFATAVGVFEVPLSQ